jgi:hypothetical protein
MAVYATYNYYTTVFLGTAIASPNFARLALRASAVIDQLTYQRAAAIIVANTPAATVTAIEMATCAVAEEVQSQELSGGMDGIQSESIGSNSVSYAENSRARLTNTAKLTEAARLYLSSTSLMFKGFFDGEYGGVPDED